MMWFEQLFGFAETAPKIRSHLETGRHPVQGNFIRSKTNGRVFPVGHFGTPSVQELREIVDSSSGRNEEPVKFAHIVIGDVLPMHAENPGAMFQVASQFNCLESPNNSTGPEAGLSRYELDNTQGPACALACAAATVWRNYFVPVRKEDGTVQEGQTNETQINCLAGLEALIEKKLWNMTNGYLSSSVENMHEFTQMLQECDRDALLASIRIGLQTRVHVNFESRRYWKEAPPAIEVHQAFCSAVPCSYDRAVPLDSYAPLAKLVLDAAYEATLLAAKACGAKRVYLTMIGGGSFGNRKEWIASAIGRALAKIGQGLDVKICHYMGFDAELRDMVGESFKSCISGAQSP